MAIPGAQFAVLPTVKVATLVVAPEVVVVAGTATKALAALTITAP
jgi:hypothetical protein